MRSLNLVLYYCWAGSTNGAVSTGGAICDLVTSLPISDPRLRMVWGDPGVIIGDHSDHLHHQHHYRQGNIRASGWLIVAGWQDGPFLFKFRKYLRLIWQFVAKLLEDDEWVVNKLYFSPHMYDYEVNKTWLLLDMTIHVYSSEKRPLKVKSSVPSGQ